MDLRKFDAAVFDLDGVVTRTETLHYAAWKRTFDDFLAGRRDVSGERERPFDLDDYRSTVDGKPRYEGVRSFLGSRGIDLPFGTPSDPPDAETVCGVGNRKNELFHELLERGEVEVIEPTLTFIRHLRERGIRVALVSSSRNARAILASAEIDALFDEIIDGEDAARYDLRGKPYPDTFLEALRRMGADPARALLVEDAVSGVQAGREAGFAAVIGLSDAASPETLLANGADRVVASLAELSGSGDLHRLPDAIECFDEVACALDQGQLAVFLDYDGTLSPIVDRPEAAEMPEAMREEVAQLASSCPVSVISGRGLADVRERVGLSNLIYAGSHGFEIRGPGLERQHPEAAAAVPALDAAEARLREELASMSGVIVERKPYAIAVHYRLAAAADVPKVARAVEESLRDFPSLRKRGGKKVFELVPDLPWDKGEAVLWLLSTLELDGSDAVPLYIGDDETDEDAFAVLTDRGIGILVANSPRSTAARYRLQDTQAVTRFLQMLNRLLERRS